MAEREGFREGSRGEGLSLRIGKLFGIGELQPSADEPDVKKGVRSTMSGATSSGARRQLDESGGKKKSSLFGKFNTRVQEAIEEGRGEEAVRQAVAETPKAPVLPADDVAIRKGKTPTSQQMIVPEGVVINGTITSASETQIAGRVDGEVMVEARLSLEPTSHVSGTVRSTSCSLLGRVDGNLECTDELIIGDGGRLNADALSGKDMTIAGEVKGNVQCGGMLRLMNTARLKGNIRARSIVISEGAIFNGKCSMANPKQNKDNNQPKDNNQAKKKE